MDVGKSNRNKQKFHWLTLIENTIIVPTYSKDMHLKRLLIKLSRSREVIFQLFIFNGIHSIKSIWYFYIFTYHFKMQAYFFCIFANRFQCDNPVLKS